MRSVYQSKTDETAHSNQFGGAQQPYGEKEFQADIWPRDIASGIPKHSRRKDS